ncbi:MAG: hypothetical protein J3Q66DRAFT_335314 [Benniella sp.]|nr:MAG: hypothetical protein J3Q66DRAFT_335314 [Benniella sp.]
MGYDYVLPIFILILTAGAFYAFSGDRISRVASSSKASLPGAFSDSVIKAKKKKPKKKSASHKSGSTVTESAETEEGRDESEDDIKAPVKLTGDRKVTSAAEAKAGKKKPTSSAVPRQPKPSKQEKEVLKKLSFEPVDEPEGSIQFVGDDSDEEDDGDDEEREEEKKAHQDSDNDDDDDDETKVLLTESRSSGIDFNKPMDPWVAQQQQQRLERIATADPHGEQTEKFARVLTIKPVVKDERIFEPIPDGFAVQKSRAGGGSSGGSGHQPTELTKKQRENMSRAAKKKEEKAALDALQEQRRKDHMKQVKGEKMNEFYRAQARKQAPESRWNTPKSTAPASSSPSPAPTSLIWD